MCVEPAAIACEDQLYLQLSYQIAVSPRGVISTQTGGFLTAMVDATASPSCVGAIKVDGSFGELTGAPADGAYAQEYFFDQGCQHLADPRFEGFDCPDSVLKDWWTFDNCVATTGQVYLLQLADGRLVKMVIDAYYAEDQDDCNNLGVAGAGSAFITTRWAWL